MLLRKDLLEQMPVVLAHLADPLCGAHASSPPGAGVVSGFAGEGVLIWANPDSTRKPPASTRPALAANGGAFFHCGVRSSLRD